MKLSSTFIRLPYCFDAEVVAREIASLPDSAWMEHPGNWAGHQQVPLISVGGHSELGESEGSMRPTEWLERLPTVQRLLLALDTVLGRSLLLRVEPGAEMKTLVDAGYYWHR